MDIVEIINHEVVNTIKEPSKLMKVGLMPTTTLMRFSLLGKIAEIIRSEESAAEVIVVAVEASSVVGTEVAIEAITKAVLVTMIMRAMVTLLTSSHRPKITSQKRRKLAMPQKMMMSSYLKSNTTL